MPIRPHPPFPLIHTSATVNTAFDPGFGPRQNASAKNLAALRTASKSERPAVAHDTDTASHQETVTEPRMLCPAECLTVGADAPHDGPAMAAGIADHCRFLDS
jgi:hypothetical protein